MYLHGVRQWPLWHVLQDSFIASLSALCSQNETVLASVADKRRSDCLDSGSINFNPQVQHKAGCVLSPVKKIKKIRYLHFSGLQNSNWILKGFSNAGLCL